MADDNQNHGDESNGPILWGLSFALASAVAFKTIGALFPRRKTEEKYGDKIEKVTQINIPIIINMPSNLEDQVKLQQNASAADLVAPTNNVASNMLPNLSDQVKLLVSNLSDQAKLELSLKLSNLNDQVKLQLTNLQDQLVKPQHKKSPINKVANNISQNHQTTSQSKPEPLGPQVTCEQLIGGLLNDDAKNTIAIFNVALILTYIGGFVLDHQVLPFPQNILAHNYCLNPFMVEKMTNDSLMQDAATTVEANSIASTSRANALQLMAPAEKLEKFAGIDFKRWQQKMFFYLTTLCLQWFTSEEAPEV
ncbi:hypothetical protein P3S68_033307 [Capsicum galapagoense]